MTLYDEYVAVVREQRELYGPMTVVLFEVGTFWEILDCDQHLGCDVPTVAALLNIQATRRNKGILQISRSNNSLAGFNTTSLQKYLPVLVAALYTVVLVSEVFAPVKGKKDAVIGRRVSRIVSKGTWVDDPESRVASQRIACMYMQYSGERLVGCGFASLDLRTGRCDAVELGSSDVFDGNLVFDTLAARVAGLDVAEILVIGDRCREDLARLNVSGTIHDLSGTALGSGFEKPAFQDLLLRKAYLDTGFLTAAEFVGLERSALALTAFVGLLDFTHRHDETILCNLPVPVTDTFFGAWQGPVSLSPTTLRDLDVLPTGARVGLAGLLNGCVTPMGQRTFHERLTCPIIDVLELTSRYDAVDSMAAVCGQVRSDLRGTHDVERCWRRLTSSVAAKTGSVDVLHIRGSLLRIQEAISHCLCMGLGTGPGLKDGAERLDDLDAVLQSLAVIDEDGHIQDGVFADVDAARELVRSYACAASTWMESVLVKLGPARAHLVRPGTTDEPCAHATCTVKRFVEVRKVLGEELAVVIDETTSRTRFTGAAVQHSAADCTKSRLELDLTVARRWGELVSEWCVKHNGPLSRIVNTTAEMDVSASIAQDAKEHHMVRPSVGSDSNGGSMVTCDGLRHPLAERVQRDTMYVPNNLKLQGGAGVLLYGVNASGKSSLSKALALAVVMAQAGMFVACSAMTFVPFHRVQTRMATRDDIYRGRSTFMVELMELRDILHRADAHTLVVGDELCSGTESASAISIVGAVCLHLVKAQSCFVLATHLHELSRLPQTCSNAAIRIYHLGVRYDPDSDALIYDRTLLDGPGKALYGLEVARSMHMPAEFMSKAHEIRRQVLGVAHDLACGKTSRFNSSVYVDVCGLCGKCPAQETHHIVPQRLADAGGHISLSHTATFHKDIAHNLVPLCHRCHLDVHSSRAVIHGYIATSQGVRLSSALIGATHG